MKSIILIIAAVVLAITIVACNRESGYIFPQDAGVVIFHDARVSIVVGDGWKSIDMGPCLPVCPPTLVGTNCMIRVYLSGPRVSDLQAAMNMERAAFDGNSNAIKDSYHQEGFTTDSGLQGQHIWFSSQTMKDGQVIETRTHSFVVQRQDGLFVDVCYFTIARTDSDAVHQMIQRTLKLQ